MVFGLLASAVTSVAAFAFPTFASYKAIKANDNTQLAPWLMFWSVQACLLFSEHWLYVVLQWVPFYREVKMFFTLWMVMPQTQGATYLYLHYLHPLMADHERDLDRVVVHLHEQIRGRGGQYVESTVSWLYGLLFGHWALSAAAASAYVGGEGERPGAASPRAGEGYVASLLSRFRTMPMGSHYGESIPSSLMAFLSMSGRDGGDIIPPNLGPEERSRYVAQQKAKLQEWLHLLDAAAQSYPSDGSSQTASPTAPRRQGAQSPSSSGARTPTMANDSDYEDLGRDEALGIKGPTRPAPQSKGSWFWKARTD